VHSRGFLVEAHHEKNEAVSLISKKLGSVEYISKHKSNPTAFIRVRKLAFITVFILILRNSVKSLQLMLNEFILETKQCYTITAGAFTKARKKLKHTAYVELNTDIVELYYRDDDIKSGL
jgi:hypothetical protein